MTPTRITSSKDLIDNLPFVVNALKALPKSALPLEDRVEVLRMRAHEDNVGIWITDRLLCVAFVGVGFDFKPYCHVWALIAFSGANLREFIFSTLFPWCGKKDVDTIQLCDTVGSPAKLRLMRTYGLRKKATVWSKQL